MEKDKTTEQLRLENLKADRLGGDIYIRQDDNIFRFGIDAVLLADFASKLIKNNSLVFDLCCGNGIVPLLLYMRNSTLKITGVEIQKEVALLAEFNVHANKLTESIRIINDDLRELDRRLNSSIGYITINPPYIPLQGGLINSNDALSAARHEIYLTLDEVASNISRLLKDRGQVFMVHRAQRLNEIITVFNKYNLKIKLLRFVHPSASKKANLVLICAMKNSGDFTQIAPPLIIYDKDNNYTEEIKQIYDSEDRSKNHKA